MMGRGLPTSLSRRGVALSGRGQASVPAGLFEGDGSCSTLPRNTIQVSYSTRSRQLAVDVQQMLLEFGVISRRYRHATASTRS